MVYAWADGLSVKAGLEDTGAALLVLIGARTTGRNIVPAHGAAGSGDPRHRGGRVAGSRSPCAWAAALALDHRRQPSGARGGCG